jgi:hypothetical protein
MAAVRPTAPPSARQRFLLSLSKDFLFWLCLLLMLGALFFVPQVQEVIFQTAQGSDSPQAAAIGSGTAWVPFFYLLYLALLLTGTIASVLLVVPASFWRAGRAVQPPPPPALSRTAALRILGVLFVLALGGFLDFTKWLGDVYPWLPVLLLGLLLFPWVAHAVFWCSAWPVLAAGRWPILCRRWVGIGLALGGLALWALLAWLGVNEWPQAQYPLGLVALNGLGLVLCLTGLWLGCFARGVRGNLAAEASGRLLGWLVCACLGGEVIWLAASLRLGILEGFAYRLYTVWSVLELLILVVLAGSLLDTAEEAANAPLRLAGLLALALFALLSSLPGNEALEAPPPVSPQVVPADWPRLFHQRIRQVPQGEPVVLVAASGGGSRAAIFAGLVLEALTREPFPGDGSTSWGDHVVLISSVSGGSLGTARFVHHLHTQGPPVEPRASLRHSFRLDLVARMKREAHLLRRHFRSAKVENRLRRKFAGDIDPELLDAFLADYRQALRRIQDDGRGDWDWVVHSPIMDDLCTDFMAPTLRGGLMPLLSRGASLRLFWRDQFSWGDCTDRGGYAAGRSRVPLVLFNASDADRGSRLAVGFPPLPGGFRMTSRPQKPSLIEDSLHPPQTLADLDPERSIGLHQAVALSANFPFGFSVLTIPRRNASDGDTVPAKVLDGGIVDNTGIDTLFFVLRSLEQARDAQDPRCRAIWSELEKRRVLLIEISSGRKPPLGGGGSWLSPLSDPSRAQKNARFDHSGLARRHYLDGLRDRLRDRAGPLPAQQVAEVEKAFAATARELGDDLGSLTGPLQDRLRKLDGMLADRFATIRFETTHLGQPNVQTAWSLGPEDKARVLVRFLVEMQLHRNELALWAADTIRSDATELAQQQLRTFFCPLLGKALARACADLSAIERLGKEGARSHSDLQVRLPQTEVHLGEVEQMADRFGIDLGAGLRDGLRKLREDIAAGREHLAANAVLTDAQLQHLRPAVLEPLVKPLAGKLTEQKQAAQARVERLRARLRGRMDWQQQLELRALLCREIHARAAAAR